MKVSYEHNMSNNYLVIENKNGDTISRYQRNLLRLNQVYGLVRTEIREVDNLVYYCYDINDTTSMLSFASRQGLEYSEVKAFLESCIQIIEGAKAYLMKEDNFILLPEFVFLKDGAQEVVLCYMDGYQKCIRQQFYELVEFLLNHINYKDQMCVRMVYELFQLLGKENTTFREMKRVIEGEKQEQPLESSSNCEEQLQSGEEDLNFQRFNQNREQIKERSPQVFIQSYPKWKEFILNYKWGVYGCMACIAFILIVLVFSFGLLDEKGSNRIDPVKTVGFLGLLGSVTIYAYRKIASLGEESMDEDNGADQYGMETEQIFEPVERCRLKDCSQYETGDMVIREFPYLIGKDKNQVNGMIHSDVISRLHARITIKNGQFYIEDLHSTNGTFVNGQKISATSPCILHDSDEITFGNVRYLFIED